MLHWLIDRKYRFPALLVGYFAIHVMIRSVVSGSLSFDESEQAFLSQWIHLGYNSQPPLYTWIQAAAFETLGHSVVALAILKNILLLGTYLLVYGMVFRGTGNRVAAVVSSLGMLTIPQVAWESHRDLSHTVAVTFATALLLYCVVRLERERKTKWYLAIGVATGIGLMSKYSFALTLLAVLIAAASIPVYRKLLRNVGLVISIVVAALIVGPHLFWMVEHLELASSKTVNQLTPSQPMSWAQRAGTGFEDLAMSAITCCLFPLVVFGPCFLMPRGSSIAGIDPDASAVGDSRMPLLLKLIERFLLCVGVVLVMMVLCGYAVTVKNHWLHPYIFLIPTYLVLRIWSLGRFRTAYANRMCNVSVACAVVVLVALIAKPISAGAFANYSWLNVPYKEFSETMRDQLESEPSVIIAPDMRTAGNLRLQFPSVRVLSQDSPHLNQVAATLAASKDSEGAAGRNGYVAIAFTGSPSVEEQQSLEGYARENLALESASARWQSIRLPYRFGRPGDKKEFALGIMR